MDLLEARAKLEDWHKEGKWEDINDFWYLRGYIKALDSNCVFQSPASKPNIEDWEMGLADGEAWKNERFPLDERLLP